MIKTEEPINHTVNTFNDMQLPGTWTGRGGMREESANDQGEDVAVAVEVIEQVCVIMSTYLVLFIYCNAPISLSLSE